MDKTPREKSQYREMLTKNLGEEDQTFKFPSTEELLSTGSDEEREEDEAEPTANIQPKSPTARFRDLSNYKNLFYTLLIGVISWMAVALYGQSESIGSLTSDIGGIKKDIGKLEMDVGDIKKNYKDNSLIQKDLEYIQGRLNFIESKLPF